MDALLQDIKYAVRLLIARRGFSVVALSTLALGIGATTAIFGVADAALIRPLPYDKPDQLLRLGLVRADRPESTQAPSLDDMDRWRSLAHIFSHVGAFSTERKVVVDGPEPEAVSVLLVTEDYLPMYGMAPILGRAFTAADGRLGATPVALLGYRYWRTRYGSDPEVLGRTIQFSNESVTIVGVLRDDESRVQTRIYMPLQATAERRKARQYPVYARLADGITLLQAQREADALFARLGSEDSTYAGYRTRLTPQYESATRAVRTTMTVLLSAVGFVLLIACVNVASLQLARGATRQSELAIRASIGAGPGRLIRQLLTESLVLAIAGSALGALVAWLTLDALVANIPVSISSAVIVRLNLRVLAATVALAAACGVLFGLAPAIQAIRTDLNAVLSRGSRAIRTTVSKAAAGVLVAIEVAAAVLLVAGAALMIRSFVRLANVPLGFDPERFVTLEVVPVDDRPEVFGPYYASLLERIRALPGVTHAGGTNHLPLSGSTSFSGVGTSPDARIGVVVQEVTPGYFEATGVPLVEGRVPDGRDVSDRSWIVLGQRAAYRLFPGESAVGQQVQYDHLWREVIGVVGDVESQGAERPIEAPQVYVSYEPGYGYSHVLSGRASGKPMVLVVHPPDPGAALPPALREAARGIGPAVIVRCIRSGHEWWSDNVVTPRRRLVLLGILGGLGLLLALVGVFGVTSFAVARRTSEIGVRMAFGARPGQVVAAVVKDTGVPIAAGVAGGLAGAFFLTRIITTFLFKTDPRDPIAFAAAALVLAACGLLAAWLPARRAARIDPVIALRAE